MGMKNPKTGKPVDTDSPLLYEGYGDRIKAVRNHFGITQKELADRIGVKPQSISELEKNKHNPSIDVVKGIAKEYGVSLNFLVFGIGPILEGKSLYLNHDKLTDDEQRLFFYMVHSKIFRYRHLSHFEILLSKEYDSLSNEIDRLEDLRNSE